MMWWCIVPAIMVCAQPANLLMNSGFLSGVSGWSVDGRYCDVAKDAGRPIARIQVPEGEPLTYPGLRQRVPCESGAIFRLTVEARNVRVEHGPGAYLAIEFTDIDGERVGIAQSSFANADGSWTSLETAGVAPADAVHVKAALIFRGYGEGQFASPRLEQTGNAALEPLNGPVTITVTDSVACQNFLGFGVEDDGWLYNPENRARGVDEADTALYRERVRTLNPAWVRMFVWLKDWCPSGDFETFTFDSPNMQSHYRTLDLYEEMGTCVNITGTEWGMHKPYANAGKTAAGIVALLEHLVRDKGYTCVKAWTLTNEPNLSFMPQQYGFEHFADIHHRVERALEENGLPIEIVGSDDAVSFNFFRQCVDDETYRNTADLFASHWYGHASNRALASEFFRDRLDLMAENGIDKHFVVGEFGFHDERTDGPCINPVMEDYDYALWTAGFCIDGLNAGVAGFAIWCLHEVKYPTCFMNYGLWNYKDRGWALRPVYYAWANFCQYTAPGNTVRRCTSTHPRRLPAAVVGDTLFWVNQGNEPAEVHIENLQARNAQIFSRSALEGEDCALRDGKFTAPEKSFGYLK